MTPEAPHHAGQAGTGLSLSSQGGTELPPCLPATGVLGTCHHPHDGGQQAGQLAREGPAEPQELWEDATQTTDPAAIDANCLRRGPLQ